MTRCIRLIAVSVILITLASGFALHFPYVWSELRKATTLNDFTANIRRCLPEKIYGRYAFLNANGLFARLIGRRIHNRVVVLNNGQLQEVGSESATTNDVQMAIDLSNEISAFFQFLRKLKVESLYVQMPTKMDLEGSLCPYEVELNAYAPADALCSRLTSGGYNVLDLRPLLVATPDAVTENFFKTDHHWTIPAAFLVFQDIAKRLVEACSIDDSAVDFFVQRKNWISQTKRDWFLGSRGRRVGRYFAGLDDLTWLEPTFQTDISCAISKKEQFSAGSFADAQVNYRQLLNVRPDFFQTNPYGVYGGDFPLVTYRNVNAPIDRRLLIVRDSFSSPIQAFLSTVFKSLDVIDLRYFGEMNLSEYVRATEPDIVMIAYNPSSLVNPRARGMGRFCGNVGGWSLTRQGKVVIKGSDTPYTYKEILRSNLLQNGELYRMRLSGCRVDGEHRGIVIYLHNEVTKEIRDLRIVDARYVERNVELMAFKIPPNGHWRMLMYAGLRTSTGGCVEFEDVSVYKQGR